MTGPEPSRENASFPDDIALSDAAPDRGTTVFTDQIEAAIAHASPPALLELSAAVWKTHAAGGLHDDEAQRLAELIHARQTVARALRETVGCGARPASLFPPRKVQRPPVRSEAIERRRRLAASGPLPPALAARFTTSEAAVLRIVGDECRDKGRCVLCIDAIAARAGCGRTTAQNALRLARRLGMVEIEERRQAGAKNLPNRITIVDREWRQWLERGPKRTGFKNLSTTETHVSEKKEARCVGRDGRKDGKEMMRRRKFSFPGGEGECVAGIRREDR